MVSLAGPFNREQPELSQLRVVSEAWILNSTWGVAETSYLCLSVGKPLSEDDSIAIEKWIEERKFGDAPKEDSTDFLVTS